MKAKGCWQAKGFTEEELSDEWAARLLQLHWQNAKTLVFLITGHVEVNYHNYKRERADSLDCRLCVFENETTYPLISRPNYICRLILQNISTQILNAISLYFSSMRILPLISSSTTRTDKYRQNFFQFWHTNTVSTVNSFLQSPLTNQVQIIQLNWIYAFIWTTRLLTIVFSDWTIYTHN